MRELKVTNVKGKLKIGSIRAFDLLADPENKIEVDTGITKDEFFAILDKASQPIKREAESDSEQSQT